MKNNIEKLIAGALITAVSAGILTGCGSSQAAASTSSTTSSAASTGAGNAETSSSAATQESAESASVTTVRGVTSGTPAPYIQLDDNNQPEGYDIAVVEAVFDRLPQYELQWIVADDGLTGLLSGQYDFSAGNWAYRDERAESYYYSYPYKLTDKVFIQRKDDEPLTSLQDAADRGYKIELGSGGPVTDAIETWNEENPDSQIEISYSDADFVTKYQHVIDGIADFAIDDSPIVSNVIATYGFTDIVANELSSEALQEVFPKVYTYYLFRKDDVGSSLRADFDATLKELKEDGTLADLSQEYFDKDVTPGDDQFESEPN